MTNTPQKPADFIHSKASVLLDLLRGLAAILVLISHWKNMFFISYHLIPAHRVWFAVPYILCTAGHQAVLIFFVLSGYLISGSIFRSLNRNQWRWRFYLTRRLVRLWIVLIPGLLLGALCDWIGLHYCHHSNLYNGLNPRSPRINIVHTFSVSAFFGNLGFLQTVLVPSFGSNTALWSLANEFWYYLLFPLGWLAIRRNTAVGQRILCITLFAVIAWFVHSSILALFPAWLAGTVLAFLPAPRLSLAHRIGATVLYVPILFLFSRVLFVSNLGQDYLFAVITAFFIWVLISAQQTADDSTGTRLVRQTARFSYTLYVVHMPALLLITCFVAGERVWSPTDLHHDAIAFLILAVLLLYAYLVATATEFRTDRVRKWVERRLESIFPSRPESSETG